MLTTQKSNKTKTMSEDKNNISQENIQNNNNKQNNQNGGVVNNFNIINKNTNLIMVKHDKEKNSFLFYDNSNNFIGSFSILELFKYINKEHTFLISTNINTSKDIIEKYICIYNDDKYEIISHLDSPFTGNIELMAGLYSDIIKVEEEINSELISKSDVDEIETIKNNNTKFIYNLLLRILKLSNLLLEQIESNPSSQKQQKDMLIRYSVGALNKICKMTKDEIIIKLMKIDNIDTKINKLEKIQENIQSQIISLNNTLEQQNKNILQILKLNENKTENITSSAKSSAKPNPSNNIEFSSTSVLNEIPIDTATETIQNKLSISTDMTKSGIISYCVASPDNDSVSIRHIITELK